MASAAAVVAAAAAASEFTASTVNAIVAATSDASRSQNFPKSANGLSSLALALTSWN